MAKTIALADVEHSVEGGNMSGIVARVIYGYHEDIAVFPAYPDGSVTPLTLDAAGTLVGDVVMKTGTRAYYLDFTEDVGTFKINTVGEADGIHFEMDLSIVKAKIKAKILGFMNAAADRKMFFIPQDENGNNYLMGSKNRGCNFVPGDGASTGASGGDRNQTSLNFKFRTRKAHIYAGDIEDVLVQVP